jgi:hypothetical protein
VTADHTGQRDAPGPASHRRRDSVRSAAVCLSVLLAAGTSAGCSRGSKDPPPTPPAVLQPVPGSALRVVTLSQSAFDALGVQTAPARAASQGLVIPTTAVIHSPDGAAWTYVVLGPRSYVRRAIVVDHEAGTEAFLRSGPAAGTAVVTAGAPELLGSEYGVGEE